MIENIIFNRHNGHIILGVLRTHKTTNPGKRSLNYTLDVVSLEKDVNIDLDLIAEKAHERYMIRGEKSCR